MKNARSSPNNLNPAVYQCPQTQPKKKRVRYDSERDGNV